MTPGLPTPNNETPEALIEAARSGLEAAIPAAEGKRVELFRRRSARVRVARSGSERPFVSVGFEEGVALRLRDADGRREGFAAANCGPAGLPLPWLVGRASESTGLCSTPWREDAVRLMDIEVDSRMPTVEEMEDWLLRATQGLDGERGRDAGEAPLASAWVEAARTEEVLLHDRGLVAFRSRLRVWAVATFRARAMPDAPERPHVIAARRMDRLRPELWKRLHEGPTDRARTGAGPGDRPIALEPEAAASLVGSLVPVLHGSEGEGGEIAVGPGWVLVDDPLFPDGLVGGTFDDAGFDARPVVLAADGRSQGRIAGPGHLRRGSFRDRPEAGPSMLVVGRREFAIPDDAWRIHSLRLHVGAAGPWVVELDGWDPSSGTIARGALLVASPLSLAEACVGSFGEPRQAGWGVVTPGLILEGLRVEG